VWSFESTAIFSASARSFESYLSPCQIVYIFLLVRKENAKQRKNFHDQFRWRLVKDMWKGKVLPGIGHECQRGSRVIVLLFL
jgi:hypothetical protein